MKFGLRRQSKLSWGFVKNGQILMGTTKSQFNLSMLWLASSVALSGCVSGDITSEINPVASNNIPIPQSSLAAEQNVDGTEVAQGNSELPTNGIPIPSTAPRPVLAMAPESVSSGQQAIQQANNLVTRAAPATNNQETITAALVEPSIATPVATVPERKLSFFELLRQKAEQRKAAELVEKKAQADKLRVARLNAASKKQSKNALPGVKKGDKLFGINKNQSAPEEEANVKVASIGGFGRTLLKRGLVLQTSSVQVGCFKPELMKVLKTVERKYGRKVMVTSGYRSPARNRRAGGVRNSSHVYCKAADIQVAGVSKWDLAKFLRTIPGRGGVGTYCRTKSVHIDVGSQRDWHHPCRRTKSRKRRS